MESPKQQWAAGLHWIFDGHNQIFSDPDLRRLQTSGAGREARETLEIWLTKFGRALGQAVWVVFDGEAGRGLRDGSLDSSFLHVFYAERGEEADDRICRLVEESRRMGRRPIVVTSDRQTLAPRVETDARILSAEEFRSVHAQVLGAPEKWLPVDLDDVERHFLSGSPFESDRRASGAEDEDSKGGSPE